jgi:hypothetical protein
MIRLCGHICECVILIFLILGQLLPPRLHGIALRWQGHFHTQFLVLVQFDFVFAVSPFAFQESPTLCEGSVQSSVQEALPTFDLLPNSYISSTMTGYGETAPPGGAPAPGHTLVDSAPPTAY